MATLRRPLLSTWRKWDWDDYLAYFLSYEAAKARAQGKDVSVAAALGPRDFLKFCKPIRTRLAKKFAGTSPCLSIQLPARNEEVELLATLVSYTLLDIEDGVAEIVVADNASTDATPDIIHACGVKYAFAATPGMGKARRAAYEAMAKSAVYIWLTDCDARAVRPRRCAADLHTPGSILRTNKTALDERPNVVGLSTGIVYEYSHPLFRCLRCVAVALGRAPRIHCWTGANQFLRRAALDAIGGIHPDIPYRDREDHQRMYELARYAKSVQQHMLSAATDACLLDPVYHSGRRRARLRDVLRAFARQRSSPRAPRDRYGFPVHPKDRIRV